MLIRNEYPRPQFVRSDWINLNGEWQFAWDDQNLGIDEKWYGCHVELDQRIQVPFVYQSESSGINLREPHDIVWYKRKVQLPERQEKKRLLLHFGAVDYAASVYVNGHLAAVHEGGHTPFWADITSYLSDGLQDVTVRVSDPFEDEQLPRGKQFWEPESRGIWYTNSTGIWQTVWLEWVDEAHLEDVQFTSYFDDGKVKISCEMSGTDSSHVLFYEVHFGDICVNKGSVFCVAKTLEWDVYLIQDHIFRTNFHDDGWSWSPEHPNLFDVQLRLENGQGQEVDRVNTYFGFRKVHTEEGMVYLNNKPYYQKLVLDQGYWPQSLLSAPSDDAYRQDILLSKKLGFNGCRKHQKMEDPRFLYWADQLGFLVWGECASAPIYGEKAVNRLMHEWSEVLKRDYNHPCIIAWVPLNESWGVPHIHNNRKEQHFSQAMYHYIHALDDSRLVVSNDGWEMTETDICAIHNYMHGGKEEREKYSCYRDTLATKENLLQIPSTSWSVYANGFAHQGAPILLTEFGGIGFDVSGEPGWGYTSVSNQEEFLEEYGRIMEAVYASSGLWGYCYTQLYDVEQEINGLLTYDRQAKCSMEAVKAINDRYHCYRLKNDIV